MIDSGATLIDTDASRVAWTRSKPLADTTVRLVFRTLVYSTCALVLVMVAIIGDLALNKRRLFYAVLGRAGIEAACRPAVAAKLRDAGFEPADIGFGEEPDITISTAAGRTMQDTFTFTDAPSQVAVDGTVACSTKGDRVSVEVRTAATPLRAT